MYPPRRGGRANHSPGAESTTTDVLALSVEIAKRPVDWPAAVGHLRTVSSRDSLSPEQLMRWVGEAQAGHREAFDHLTRHFASLVHGVLLAHAPRTEVDDLLQDVFLKAWQSLSSLREAQSFGPWLATLARNRAMDFQRRKRPEVDIDALELSDAKSGHDAEAIRIFELIRTLPETYREALILRLVEGLTGPEIALRTGLTHGSVRVNLHRGLGLLRSKLGVKS